MMAQARWWLTRLHTQQLFGPEWWVGVVTDIRSSDICVNFTIIRYEPLEGGSAIDRAVGTQAHWHRHDGTDGLS